MCEMGEYLSLSWLDNFVYERNEKGDLQNNKEDMEASEPAEQYMSQIDPDIFSNVDFITGGHLLNTIAPPRYHLDLKQQMLTELKSRRSFLKPLGSQNGLKLKLRISDKKSVEAPGAVV